MKYTCSNKTFANNIMYTIAFCLILSWIYGLCSQIIIPLPFILPPLSIQPLPIMLAACLYGKRALYAYLFYLIQGALGFPLFSNWGSGPLHLMGPTGGYLLGFLLAAIILHKPFSTKKILFIGQLYFAIFIVFLCGLAHLASFVPTAALLSQGLYPFLFGDFIAKPAILYSIMFGYQSRR